MTEEAPTPTSTKRRSGRSPAYPFISVKKALDQADALRKQEGEYDSPLPSAFKAWGYGEKSSGGRQTLATLKYYGLIDVSGDGDARKVKVSDVARRILLDNREDETEKKKLIRQIALSPNAHRVIYDQYPNGLASDGTVEHFLVFEHHFKPDAAKELLAEYKETTEFAEVYKPDNSLDKNEEEDDNKDGRENNFEFSIGDLINWESGGQIMWKMPREVVEINEDDIGDKYLKVRSSDNAIGWIPMNQAVTPENAGTPARTNVFAPPPPDNPGVELDDRPPPQGFSKEVIDLDEGSGTFIWPKDISADSYSDLEHWVNGILNKAKRRAGIKNE